MTDETVQPGTAPEEDETPASVQNVQTVTLGGEIDESGASVTLTGVDEQPNELDEPANETPATVAYRVTPQDSWDSLGARFGVDPLALYAANVDVMSRYGVHTMRSICVGAVIQVPGTAEN